MLSQFIISFKLPFISSLPVSKGIQCVCQPCGQSEEKAGSAEANSSWGRGLSYSLSLRRRPIPHRVRLAFHGPGSEQCQGRPGAGREGHGRWGDEQ